MAHTQVAAYDAGRLGATVTLSTKGDIPVRGASALTKIAAGADGALLEARASEAAGLAFVDLPIRRTITTGIDGLSTSPVTLLTVPASTIVLVLFALVRATVATDITTAPRSAIGANAGVDDIIPAQDLTGFTVTTKAFLLQAAGNIRVAAATDAIKWKNHEAAVGSSSLADLQLDVHLFTISIAV